MCYYLVIKKLKPKIMQSASTRYKEHAATERFCLEILWAENNNVFYFFMFKTDSNLNWLFFEQIRFSANLLLSAVLHLRNFLLKKIPFSAISQLFWMTQSRQTLNDDAPVKRSWSEVTLNWSTLGAFRFLSYPCSWLNACSLMKESISKNKQLKKFLSHSHSSWINIDLKNG